MAGKGLKDLNNEEKEKCQKTCCKPKVNAEI